jgi:hypothetical protein
VGNGLAHGQGARTSPAWPALEALPEGQAGSRERHGDPRGAQERSAGSGPRAGPRKGPGSGPPRGRGVPARPRPATCIFRMFSFSTLFTMASTASCTRSCCSSAMATPRCAAPRRAAPRRRPHGLAARPAPWPRSPAPLGGSFRARADPWRLSGATARPSARRDALALRLPHFLPSLLCSLLLSLPSLTVFLKRLFNVVSIQVNVQVSGVYRLMSFSKPCPLPISILTPISLPLISLSVATDYMLKFHTHVITQYGSSCLQHSAFEIELFLLPFCC